MELGKALRDVEIGLDSSKAIDRMRSRWLTQRLLHDLRADPIAGWIEWWKGRVGRSPLLDARKAPFCQGICLCRCERSMRNLRPKARIVGEIPRLPQQHARRRPRRPLIESRQSHQNHDPGRQHSDSGVSKVRLANKVSEDPLSEPLCTTFGAARGFRSRGIQARIIALGAVSCRSHPALLAHVDQRDADAAGYTEAQD